MLRNRKKKGKKKKDKREEAKRKIEEKIKNPPIRYPDAGGVGSLTICRERERKIESMRWVVITTLASRHAR